MNGGRASRRGLAAPSPSSTDPARTPLNGTASARIPATHPITTISDVDAMTLELMEHVVEMCILEECFDEHRTLSVLSRFHAYPTQEPIDLAVHGAVNSNGLPSSASAPSLVSAGGTSSTTSAGTGKAGRAPECVCQTCKRSIAASRFAPHLEKCLGMGRNSCRVARRKMQAYSETPTKEATPSSRGDGSDEEDEATPHDAETDDDDWSSKKKKKGKSKAKRRKTEREHSA